MADTKSEQMLRARYWLSRASESLYVGYWMVFEGVSGDFHYREGVEALTKAAAALGFDLVKRPAVDEAALEMHFSDGALPVTDKPGFDGRDNSSIDDNVWSR